MDSVIEKDFHEEEYFGNVRLDDTAVLQTSEDVVISMKNLHKTYLLGVEGVPALRGVSLTIKRGEFVCIFGTSGGGKTTMLNIIGTIDKPTKGEMILCGKLINHKTDDLTLAMIRLKKIGFVFQTFNLLSSLTALENVEMPMILAGELSGEERKARATSLLTMVGMGGRLDHVPSQLSGGEQQRVTIARAMANKPDILLLDEPTGDLDTANTAIVMKLLTQLNKEEGITLVMVTHDVGLKMFSDRVVWMRDGKIQQGISDGARQDAHRKLDEEIERIEKKKAGLLKRAATATVMRDPSDYKPLSWRKPQSLNHSGNIASSSSSTHVNGHVADRSVSPNLAGPNQNGTSQAGPSGVNGHHMVETTNDRYTEYLQSHSTIFPPEQHQQQNGRSHKKTASGGGEEEKGPVLEEIIDGISSGLVLHGENGDGVEDDQESSLKRKKPVSSAPLLVDDEIQLDDGTN